MLNLGEDFTEEEVEDMVDEAEVKDGKIKIKGMETKYSMKAECLFAICVTVLCILHESAEYVQGAVEPFNEITLSY